jgi:phosphatidylglycerophosphate synthase
MDGLLDRVIHRRCSRLLIPFLLRLRVTPNVVTLASLALGLASAWQFWHATPPSALLGLFFYVMQAVADHCDGDLARLTFRESALGHWLDVSADTVSNTLIVLGMSLTAGSVGGRGMFLVGVAAAIGILMSSLFANFFLPRTDRGGRVKRAILRLGNRDPFYAVLIGFILLLWTADWLLPQLIWLLAIGSQAYWLTCLAQRIFDGR